jgi:Cysteinyl-tRNA synthetase
VFELVKYANTHINKDTPQRVTEKIYEQMDTLCNVLGIILEKEEEILDSEIEELIAARQAARKAKDFAKADAIRAELLEKGILLEDTREGVKWKRG